MKNNKLKLIYWISTGFIVLICVFSGIQNIMITDKMKEINEIHKFNLLLLPFFGVLKISGVITILIPALKRFKEAAYAGLVFYFIGATYVNVIDGSKSYVTTIVILLAVVISYLTALKQDSKQAIVL